MRSTVVEAPPCECQPVEAYSLLVMRRSRTDYIMYTKMVQPCLSLRVRKMVEICRRVMEQNQLNADDIDLFVSHQANRRIILNAAEHLGVGPDKIVIILSGLVTLLRRQYRWR
ncbi:MAG: hypothetical protein Ct9H300mP25_15500 [Acidobacteriota bacterium]|nr:MAG: hypothetical protein Ct9H300mP25_15500 [Acidobacteriota bacterium]